MGGRLGRCPKPCQGNFLEKSFLGSFKNFNPIIQDLTVPFYRHGACVHVGSLPHKLDAKERCPPHSGWTFTLCGCGGEEGIWGDVWGAAPSPAKENFLGKIFLGSFKNFDSIKFFGGSLREPFVHKRFPQISSLFKTQLASHRRTVRRTDRV